MRFLLPSLLLLMLSASGCMRMAGTSRTEFNEGSYRTSSLSGQVKDRVYVQVFGDTMTISRRIREGREEVLEQQPVAVYPRELPSAPRFGVANYYQPSFDVDVLTIPFKYRHATAGFPALLNSAFNAAIYMGYRTDVYRVSYHRAPTRMYRRHITHFGLSFGGFAGIGSTPMNPWVTQPAINAEYDGFIIPFGIATILGINDLSFGINLGMDRLMDEDRSVWIYDRKPWIGASFGINLN